jgi:hypothetical protein
MFRPLAVTGAPRFRAYIILDLFVAGNDCQILLEECILLGSTCPRSFVFRNIGRSLAIGRSPVRGDTCRYIRSITHLVGDPFLQYCKNIVF